MSNESRTYCRLPILALSISSNINMGNLRRHEQLFRIYRPNTGLQQRHETLDSLRKKYEKVRYLILLIFIVVKQERERERERYQI
jgi:hypothetical protein